MVGELCGVLQLPQSTVSRHLKILSDEGWVVARGEGTSRFYSMIQSRLDPAAKRLWLVLRGPVSASPGGAPVARRRSRLSPPRRAARRHLSQRFLSTRHACWEAL